MPSFEKEGCQSLHPPKEPPTYLFPPLPELSFCRKDTRSRPYRTLFLPLDLSNTCKNATSPRLKPLQGCKSKSKSKLRGWACGSDPTCSSIPQHSSRPPDRIRFLSASAARLGPSCPTERAAATIMAGRHAQPSTRGVCWWTILTIILSLCPQSLAQGTDTVSKDGTRWIQYTGNDGTVWLDDDRQPSLYTQSFGDCQGDSLINVTRFDAAYYRDNMTVLFHLGGNTALADEDIMRKSCPKLPRVVLY